MIHQPLRRRAGPGDRHRDPRARDPQDARAAEPDLRRRTGPAALEKIQADMERDFFLDAGKRATTAWIDRSSPSAADASPVRRPPKAVRNSSFRAYFPRDGGAAFQLSLPRHRPGSSIHGREKGSSSESAVLLVLRQEPARGEEADRRAVGVHLRRVHRAVQRHHPRRSARPRRAGAWAKSDLPIPAEIKAIPRPVRDRPGAGQAHAVGGGLQPLQAAQARRRAAKDEVELVQEQHPAHRADRLGKTLLAQTLARLLNVPFVIADATTLTEAGYVGEDVENIIQKLLQNCNYDVEKAQRGIVYIDEIDKISAQGRQPQHHPRRRARACSRRCSSWSKGTMASVPPQGGRKHRTRSSCRSTRPTSCSSAAGRSSAWRRSSRTAPEKAASVSARRCAARPSGASARCSARSSPEDLIKFGLIPEFVGRLPVVATLGELDETRWCRSSPSRRTRWSSSTRSCSTWTASKLEIHPRRSAAIAQRRWRAQDRRPRPAPSWNIADRHHVRPASLTAASSRWWSTSTHRRGAKPCWSIPRRGQGQRRSGRAAAHGARPPSWAI